MSDQEPQETPQTARPILSDELGAWQPIKTVPHFEFVWAYCKQAHETSGAASQSKGGMVVAFHPKSGKLPSEFIDHFGCVVHWKFTHWMPLPEAPNCEVRRG